MYKRGSTTTFDEALVYVLVQIGAPARTVRWHYTCIWFWNTSFFVLKKKILYLYVVFVKKGWGEKKKTQPAIDARELRKDC